MPAFSTEVIMSMKIILTYNPYFQTVSLRDEKGDRMTPRLAEFLRGRMEDWLDYRTVSYRCWRGLLPELMLELNEDALDITFEGVREDYLRLQEGLSRQCENLGEYGYDDDAWRLQFRERFAPDVMLARMQRLSRENEVFNSPTQEVSEKRDFRRREQERCLATVDAVDALRRKWLAVYALAVEKAGTEEAREIWRDEVNKLNQAFEI